MVRIAAHEGGADGSDGALASPSQVRAGIVGTGSIAGVHANAVRAAGGEVVAVLGSRPATTAGGVTAMRARRGVADLAELLAAPDVDVLHICTPNWTHTDMALAALAAGKHVICEKPLATSVTDARRLTDLADEVGCVASVPFVYRFYASVREANVGSLTTLAARSGFCTAPICRTGCLRPTRPTGGWILRWAVGPRAFGDIGVHWCDLMEFTTGHRIARLAARMGTAHKRRDTGPDTEDGAVIVFETDRGHGLSGVSQVTPGRKNRLWFSFDGPDASLLLRPGNARGSVGRWAGRERRGDAGDGAAHVALLPPSAGHPQGYQDAFNADVQDVYAAVGGDSPDGLPVFADGLRAAVLTQAVVDAAASQAWVEVSE